MLLGVSVSELLGLDAEPITVKQSVLDDLRLQSRKASNPGQHESVASNNNNNNNNK